MDGGLRSIRLDTGHPAHYLWEMRLMATVRFIMVICLVAFPAFAQEETLIKGDVESGGFGGPVVKMTSLNGQDGILVGGRGGWILNHSFIIGGGGYGLANNVRAKVPGSER